MDRIILASASPRRAELLRAAGIAFDIMPANVDETVRPGESPQAYVTRVAGAKARAVLPRADGRRVLAADTVVVVDDAILGKPIDRDDARRMLRMLSGRAHQVMTAVALCNGVGTHYENRNESRPLFSVVTRIESTVVEFAELADAEIEWYVATGEADDKAGAYAVQGYASRFVTRVNGSYSNVVGLPIALVYEMIKSLGG